VPDSLRVWLSATALNQSDDPAVRALADSICAGMSDPWLKSTAISDWVFGSLEKKMSVTLPSAVEVLASRRGDCNEHATLFCALARAAGVPARLCLGVVFMEGRFYYHAWNAVWCGEWIELDPAFGQSPADAARVRLVSGDLSSQTRLLPAMGRLKIEVVESR
jgi:transglutaminase-like putative cysteine protease